MLEICQQLNGFDCGGSSITAPATRENEEKTIKKD
jgi:hypothetical protein